MYAILSHGGRQYRVSAGDRLVVDRLDAEVGSVIALEPVLLTGGDGKTALGTDLDGLRVAVTVLAHRRGEKLRIFKYKAKKRSRKVAGYRSDLTELRVESILAKGAVLPRSSAARMARADAVAADPTAPARRRASARATETKTTETKTTETKTTETKPAAAVAKAAPSEAPAASPPARSPKRAQRGSARPKPAAGSARTDVTAAPEPRAKASAATPKSKASPKRAPEGGPAARAKDEGDGA